MPVNKDGHLEPDTLKAALKQDTILVSVMYVNNEIGAIEPIAELGKVIKDFNPEIISMLMQSRHSGKLK